MNFGTCASFRKINIVLAIVMVTSMFEIGNGLKNLTYLRNNNDFISNVEIMNQPVRGVDHIPTPPRSIATTSTNSWQGGIAFVKTFKTGSSTLGGVVRRIGARHNLAHTRDGVSFTVNQTCCSCCGWLDDEQDGLTTPAVWANHGKRSRVEPLLRKRLPNAFYLTAIRQPVESALSAIYYNMSRHRRLQNTDAIKIELLQQKSPEFYLNYLAEAGKEKAKEVMESYDFVVVQERFDESLLILGRMLNIHMVDMLYLRAKQSGSAPTDPNDLNGHPGQHGHQLVSIFHPPFNQEAKAVQEAAKHLLNGGDMELFILANIALDKYRKLYGPEFDADLTRFGSMIDKVEVTCRQYWNATRNSCLWSDNGCGQECIDRLAFFESWNY